MKITYLGHSAFHIETLGIQLIIDPFISGNPKTVDIEIDELKADYLLITHGHQDHVLDVEQIAGNNPDIMIISSFEIVTYYNQRGINGHGMNHGGKFSFDFGAIKMVNAIHSSSFADGTYAGNPAGFIIRNEEGCLYIAGDTALTMDMQLIPQTGFTPDAAILPVGDNFTMGIEEAVIASDFIKCNHIIGCHFDTFPPIEINHEQAIELFTSKGKTLQLPKIGKLIEIKKQGT